MDIQTLVGKTLKSINGKVGGDEVLFETTDGKFYKLYHRQDCCESVTLNDICGNLQDLVGSPICQAEEATSQQDPDGLVVSEYRESFTWTFYRLATIKGQVVIRWLGESNGWYSESVDFEEVN